MAHPPRTRPISIRFAHRIGGWVAILCLVATVLPAQTPSITATGQLGVFVSPDHRTLLSVTLTNPTARDLTGSVVVGEGDKLVSGGVRVRAPYPVRVPPRSHAQVEIPIPTPDARVLKTPRSEPQDFLIVWEDSSGREVARSTAYVQHGTTNRPQPQLQPYVMVAGRLPDPEQSPQQDIYEAAQAWGTALDLPLQVAPAVEAPKLPDRIEGYDSVRIAVLGDLAWGDLTVSQQQALTNFVLAGGTLMVPYLPGRNHDDLPADFGPCPVRGSRLLSQLPGQPQTTRFRSETNTWELEAPAGSTILAGSGPVTYAFSRPMGMGTVVWTGFACNALDAAQPAADFWRRTLAGGTWQRDFRRQVIAPQSSARGQGDLPMSRALGELLGSLAGISTPSPVVAWAVVGGYLLAAALAMLVFRGARRPMAYVAILAASAVLTVVIVAFSMLGSRGDRLTVGRIQVTEYGPDGKGWVREVAVACGTETPDLTAGVANRDGSIQHVSEANRSAQADTLRYGMDLLSAAAPARRTRLGQVFAFDGPAQPGFTATLDLAETGGTVTLSGTGVTPASDRLLVCGRQSIRLSGGDASGSLALGQENPFSEYLTSNIVSQEDGLRRRMLSVLLAPHAIKDAGRDSRTVRELAESPLELLTWTDGGAGLAAFASAGGEQAAPLVRELRLVRAPVKVTPIPKGARARIPSALCTMGWSATDTRPPVEEMGAPWVSSGQDGKWTLCFRPHSALGPMAVVSGQVILDLQCPAQDVVVSDGAGQVLGRWTSPLGRYTVDVISARPQALDLVFEVSARGGGAGNIPMSWQVRGIHVSLLTEGNR